MIAAFIKRGRSLLERFAGNGKATFASPEMRRFPSRFLRSPPPSGDRCGLYDFRLTMAVVDAKEYAMKPTPLHQVLRHEVRLMKLDLTIDSLQRELALATATQRQCIHALVGAMVISGFCMLLAFMTV